MTTRDFARFGLLYLRRGGWDGEPGDPSTMIQSVLALFAGDSVPGRDPAVMAGALPPSL